MIPHERDPDFDHDGPPPQPAVAEPVETGKPRRTMSTVTGYALGGYTVGTALAAIVVWVLAQVGVDATEIAEPLGFVIQALGVAFGGWAAPPQNQDKVG